MAEANAAGRPRARAIEAPGLSTSPLSAAWVVDGVIYTSGQVGRDPKTGEVPSEMEDQIRVAMSNLQQVLQAAGGSLASVVKTTVYLVRRDDFAAMNTLYAGYFPGAKPARSTLIVELARPDLLFEIEAIAYVETGG
ncbi:MAG TPA: RidA family protein [Chloroflexota bacterium]|nr:RidA family protein [Chloroflexota bacterium]